MKTRSANTKEDKPYVGVQLTPEEREKIGKARRMLAAPLPDNSGG